MPLRRTKNHEGVALLLVLWVLAILMVIVISFSLLTRADLTSTLAYSKGVEKKFLAEAGIHRAISEIFYRKDDTSLQEEGPWKGDGRPYREEAGGGSYVVRMTDETGKVDINSAPDIVLKRLLENHGVGSEEATIIVDSLMDWKDPDDLYRLNGAESDYYQSLEEPYSAKNGPFETPEELILVRGMTRDLLYGSGDKEGIIGLLTVNAGSSRINVKAAPKEVLMAVPGMTEVAADAIIAYRSEQEIRNLRDIQGIAGAGYALMARYITATDGRAFTVDSTGYREGESWGYPIRATVVIEGDDGYRFVYYKNPAYAGKGE